MSGMGKELCSRDLHQTLNVMADRLGCIGIVDEARVSSLLTWLLAMKEWNQRIDLTAARDDGELFDLALADALVLAQKVNELGLGGSHWVDVGAGAGAPGLPLALLRPDLRVDLVEPKSKRIAFLRFVVGKLGLSQVTVIRGRLQDLDDLSADCAVSRATLSPEDWVEQGHRLARSHLWVLLAQGEAPSLSGWEWAVDHRYQWPVTQVGRRLVGYRRTVVTEPNHP